MQIFKLKFKHIISPKKWKHFIVGTLIRKFIGGVEYAEQVLYRQSVCRDCFEQGSCSHCGCSFPDAALVPDNKCSAGKWDEMYSASGWKKFKKIYGIKININE